MSSPHQRARGGARTAALAVLWLGVVLACDAPEADTQADFDEKPATVEVTRVEAELLRDVATFSGQLDSEFGVMLRSETDGVIESIEFAEGQEVEAGDALFRLRDGEQRALLREAEANLALARENRERAQNLMSRDATSKAQRDRAEAELQVATARVALRRVELDRTTIRAPFAGLVGARLVSPGDRVTEDTPLARVDAMERLQASFAISEQGVAFARVGAPVEVSVRPFPNERFRGEVFYVAPTLDPDSRRLFVKAWVPNPDRRLRPGLFANVDLEIDRRENAVLVPESAVFYDRGGSYVWEVDEEQRASRSPVDLGLRQRGRVEVKLGLQPGDLIVRAGTHKVMEGKELRFADPTPRGQARREPPARAGGGGRVRPGA